MRRYLDIEHCTAIKKVTLIEIILHTLIYTMRVTAVSHITRKRDIHQYMYHGIQVQKLYNPTTRVYRFHHSTPISPTEYFSHISTHKIARTQNKADLLVTIIILY